MPIHIGHPANMHLATTFSIDDLPQIWVGSCHFEHANKHATIFAYTLLYGYGYDPVWAGSCKLAGFLRLLLSSKKAHTQGHNLRGLSKHCKHAGEK
jgi:hypothetical protein